MKRDSSIDVLKGILIILVVIGHVDNGYISKFINIFHMPAFFFVSGMLFKDEYIKNTRYFIKNRVVKLYISFIKYNAVILVLHNVFVRVGIYSANSETSKYMSTIYTLKDYLINFFKLFLFSGVEQLGGATWFLISMIQVSIMFYIIRKIIYKISKNKLTNDFIVFIIIGVIANLLVINNIKLVKFLDTSIMGLYFYYMGYLYSKLKLKIKFDLKYFIFTLSTLLIFTPKLKVSMVNNSYTNILLFNIMSVLGIYISLMFSELIKDKKTISIIGRYTLEIMSLHFLAFKIVSLLCAIILKNKNIIGYFPVFYEANVIIKILYVIIGVLIPIIISKFIKKILELKKGENNETRNSSRSIS